MPGRIDLITTEVKKLVELELYDSAETFLSLALGSREADERGGPDAWNNVCLLNELLGDVAVAKKEQRRALVLYEEAFSLTLSSNRSNKISDNVNENLNEYQCNLIYKRCKCLFELDETENSLRDLGGNK